MVCSREYLSKEYDNRKRNITKRTQAETHTPRASPEKHIDLMIGTGEDPWIRVSLNTYNNIIDYRHCAWRDLDRRLILETSCQTNRWFGKHYCVAVTSLQATTINLHCNGDTVITSSFAVRIGRQQILRFGLYRTMEAKFVFFWDSTLLQLVL